MKHTLTLFTIGFTGKAAMQFFGALKAAGVRRVIDTRRWPDTQLSGFAKKKDLPFFLKELSGIAYEHWLDLAPSEQILRDYKDKKITWAEYEKQYVQLLKDRNIINKLAMFDIDNTCFLCAEHTAEQCHRRLLVEYLQSALMQKNITITHL